MSINDEYHGPIDPSVSFEDTAIIDGREFTIQECVEPLTRVIFTMPPLDEDVDYYDCTLRLSLKIKR